MKRADYRAAFDAVPFREDFEERTVSALLKAVGQQSEKENQRMKANRIRKTGLIAAAVAVVLVASAAAATLLLRPQDVALQLSDPTLAAAFESQNAVTVDQSVESGDYRITLAGLVSGAGLSDFTADVDEGRTYVVASLARLDGADVGDAEHGVVLTPLVAGFAPWQVNAWTLGGARASFTVDGVAYYLFDCGSLEMFADRTVYLAAYEGLSPSSDYFQMAEDGSISFTDNMEGAHALFTLPLDAAKADPAAVEQFLADNGIPS